MKPARTRHCSRKASSLSGSSIPRKPYRSDVTDVQWDSLPLAPSPSRPSFYSPCSIAQKSQCPSAGAAPEGSSSHTVLSTLPEGGALLCLAQYCAPVGSLSGTRSENLSGSLASLFHPLLLKPALSLTSISFEIASTCFLALFLRHNARHSKRSLELGKRSTACIFVRGQASMEDQG